MTDQNVTSVPPQPPAAPTPPETGAKLDYQPVSIWAVFGFLAGGSVAAIVLGTLIYTFATGNAVQVPTWLVLILGLTGAIVSFIAQRQIVASEGTRTGMRLARWGLWLSVLTGAGFFVFNLSTRLALQSQANAFIMQKSADDEGKKVPDSGFVPRLLEGVKGDRVQLYSAFLLTQQDRGGVDPNDADAIQKRYAGSGTGSKEKIVPYLTRFYDNNAMVRFLRDTLSSLPADQHDKVQIEPLGVLECEFESPGKGKGRGHYKVVRNYKVSTPEYVRVFSIEARSIEPSSPGERRKWVVGQITEQENTATMNPLGRGLKGLRIRVFENLREWTEDGVSGLGNIDKTTYDQLIKPEDRAHQVRRIVAEIHGPTGNQLNQLHIVPNDLTPWERVGSKIRISYPVQTKLVVGDPPVGLELKGFIIVESESDVDPETFTPNSPPPVWSKNRTLKWTDVEQFEAPAKKERNDAKKSK